jgi:hypothetical protein
MPIPGLASSKQSILKCNASAGNFNVDGKMLTQIGFALDMDNAEVGQAKFVRGQEPVFVMARVTDIVAGASFPEPPDESFGKSFRCRVKLSDGIGTPSVREFSTGSFVVFGALDDLFDHWQAARRDHPGQLPVVFVTEFDAIEGKFGVNYAPRFDIIDWIDRPPDLPDRPLSAPPVRSGLPTVKTASLDDLDDEIPF